MPRIVIYGAGGFGREVLPVAQTKYAEAVFASDQPSAPVLGLPVIRPSEILADDHIFIAVALPDDRQAIAGRFAGHHFATLIAPSAIIGPDVEMGEGSIFSHFSHASVSVRIGRHFHCNAYSYVAHDCTVGDFVTFAGQVNCNGNVHIGDGVSVGSAAVLRPGTLDRPLKIGAGAVIGCGAVVTKDVPPGAIMVGNPAKPLERSLRVSSSRSPATSEPLDHAGSSAALNR